MAVARAYLIGDPGGISVQYGRDFQPFHLKGLQYAPTLGSELPRM